MNKKDLQDIISNLEDCLTETMSGLYTQDMETTIKIGAKENQLKHLISTVSKEIDSSTKEYFFTFLKEALALNGSWKKYERMIPVIKHNEDDDTGRCYKVYEVPKENIQYFYSKEMTDKELESYLKGLKYELKDEEIVLSSSPSSLNERVYSYYVIQGVKK